MAHVPVPASVGTGVAIVPLTVVGQHTSLAPALVGVHPAATAADVCAASQSSLRGFPAWPAHSESVSDPAFCWHATVVSPPVGVPNTVVGQQTSDEPSRFATQPTFNAAACSSSPLQSSMRGFPALPAQSLSVSDPGSCSHASFGELDEEPEEQPENATTRAASAKAFMTALPQDQLAASVKSDNCGAPGFPVGPRSSIVAGMGRLEGKIAIITGGASGIGRATVLRLAAAGCRVVATDVDPAGERVVAGVDGACFVEHDVADEAAWERAIDATLRAHGRLDVLVNNAGVSRVGAVTDMTLQDWRALMAINLDGVFLGVKHGIRAMRRHGEGGAIVNVSSISGIVGAPMSSAYCASKGGVRLLTKAVALECAAEKIRVNSVHPGAVRTAIWSTVGLGPQDEAAIAAAQPMGRMAEPEEVADAIAYLASDAARFMTGSELVIDGGWSAG